ncbi:MAG: DUF1194 domain-containing protein [Pseudomonadota bacterium]
MDLELVLAVDVSMSMDLDEQRHQRQGYVSAFQSPAILQAITSGPERRIAVTYMEWAGVGTQSVIVPWRVIGSAADAQAFAKALAEMPTRRALMTSISGALTESARLFDGNGLAGTRRVIDISGDGPNNIGGRVDRARDKVLAKGIVINGLPLQFKRPDGPYSYFDLPDLDKYYAACVIGGPGAFMIAVQDRKNFGQAIRQKLLLEIADRQPPAPAAPPAALFKRAQFRVEGVKPKYDCLIGEKRWQQYQYEQW